MYTTAEAADSLGIKPKRLDNILTGPGRALVPIDRNGRSRALGQEIIESIAIALLLERDLGISIARGLITARELIADTNSSVPVGTLGSLHFDVAKLRLVLTNALGDAVEDRNRPRRGRPSLAERKKRGASL